MQDGKNVKFAYGLLQFPPFFPDTVENFKLFHGLCSIKTKNNDDYDKMKNDLIILYMQYKIDNDDTMIQYLKLHTNDRVFRIIIEIIENNEWEKEWKKQWNEQNINYIYIRKHTNAPEPDLMKDKIQYIMNLAVTIQNQEDKNKEIYDILYNKFNVRLEDVIYNELHFLKFVRLRQFIVINQLFKSTHDKTTKEYKNKVAEQKDICKTLNTKLQALGESEFDRVNCVLLEKYLNTGIVFSHITQYGKKYPELIDIK